MSLEKILHKMQEQINELVPTLELFLEETIQPSVDNCEKLQKQINQLQENLAVYKYNKFEKEISPSFNIHAKVSEKELPQQVIQSDKEETEKQEPEVVETIPSFSEITKEIIQEDVKTVPQLSIGINDKFRFINELFIQNASEYNIAIEQLSTLKTWNDTEIYLNSLKTLYDWRENNEVANYFFSIIKKRFN